ncbi:MAG: YggS family pyridoxal phosphate-dependent enzyme [Pseudomonadota bacterium]
MSLERRFTNLQARILAACRAAQRSPQAVRLLAVSKTRPAEQVHALQQLGQHAFGENYVSDALAKVQALHELPIEWHFIGPLQSNKTQAVARHFDWVQSVDREKIVRRLAEQRPTELSPLQVLIQVNIDREPQKSGCLPEQVDALAEAIASHSTLNLRGLMAIPTANQDQVSIAFEGMHRAFEQLAAIHPSVDTLSMGMSNDLEQAIAAGASMIRIGTDLFGPRQP